MANTSKHNSSINAFISQATAFKQIRFPDQQITLYCKQNECQHEKIINMFQCFYEKFKWNYENFNEIIVLLSIALKKIELKSSNQNQEQIKLIIKNSLQFIEDLATSKMLLVCLSAKTKNKSINEHFVYAKGFIRLLVLQILNFQLQENLIVAIQNCNNSFKSKNFITLNFLVQYMLISTTIEFLSEQSERKFKITVMDILQRNKKLFINTLWNLQRTVQNKLQFKQIGYLRLDIQSYKINFVQISNEGILSVNDKEFNQPEEWVLLAYQKKPDTSLWKTLKINNIFDIYQFLFKLQVFASSSLIESLDQLITDEQFIEIFGKFLMGEKLIQQIPTSYAAAQVIKNLFDIKNIYQKASKPYKDLLKKQVYKIISDSAENQIIANQQFLISQNS